MTSSKSNYLQKVPSLNTITLEVGASTYEFGGGCTIESIAAPFLTFDVYPQQCSTAILSLSLVIPPILNLCIKPKNCPGNS